MIMLLDVQETKYPMKKRRRDVGALLVEQIGMLAGSGPTQKSAQKPTQKPPTTPVVRILRERPWASITFSGTRHHIGVSGLMPGDGALSADFATILAAHEFDLPGHFVADMLIDDDSARDRIMIEILTIIDPVPSRNAAL